MAKETITPQTKTQTVAPQGPRQQPSVVRNLNSENKTDFVKSLKLDTERLNAVGKFARDKTPPTPEERRSQAWEDYGRILQAGQEAKNELAASYKEANPDAKELSIDDLKEKAYLGILDDDQKKALDEKLKKQEESNDKTSKVTQEENDHREPKEEEDPLKDGDIIEYMYNDWLIKGANALIKGAKKGAKKFYYNLRSSFSSDLDEKAKQDKSPDPKTTKTRAYEVNTNGDIADNFLKREKHLDDTAASLTEKFKLISQGKLTEAGVPEETKKRMLETQKKNPKFFKEFAEGSIKNIKNMTENIKHIEAISANLVSAEANWLKAKDGNTEAMSKEALNKRQSEMTKAIGAYIIQSAAEGKDTPKLIENLLKDSAKAKEFVHKQIDKDNVDEFSTDKKKRPADESRIPFKKDKPLENKPYNDIMAQINGVDGSSQQKSSLMEALMGRYSTDEYLNAQALKNKDVQETIKIREEKLAERRKKVARLKELEEKFGRRNSVLDMTAHKDGNKKESPFALTDELATSRIADNKSNGGRESDATKNIIQTINRNKSK
ncbi:MAG: hypothetical protein PHE89_05930 [Alphaproteobacteria bacterium]|nr:hypothetical protein [Alphaproteobacteria bacterium]